MTRLAINGGDPVIASALAPYRSIRKEEAAALQRVIDRGSLSGFYGSYCPEFLGGDEVKEFERRWALRFGVEHAVSVNSNTSGLYAAMGAIGLNPGDEVIVPPTTMSATVMAPLVYGAIPVFADIEEETFCIDPDEVRRKISCRTKAVIAVNLFGHPARLTELRQICDERQIFLIEDNAQAPLGHEFHNLTGTIGDIGVFSLNYHKHIHAGEGGVCVTNDEKLAFRLQSIRNHAENIVEHTDLNCVNMVGFNFRMTEMSAAVASAQLAKIDAEVMKRQVLSENLSAALSDLAGVRVPVVRESCRHVYYLWSARIDEAEMGVSLESFSNALMKEGFPNFIGYVRPLYMLPTFQDRIAFGDKGWPFSQSSVTYEPGLCPTAERLHKNELLCFEPCAYDVDSATLNLLIEAFRKVHSQRHEIK